MKRKYCAKCGHKKKKYPTGYYSELTGRMNNDLRCENPKCEDGCENVGGHIYPKESVLLIFSTEGDTCRRCGYTKFSGWDYL